MTSLVLKTVHACWVAKCSHWQTATVVLAVTGTRLSEAAIEDHFRRFNDPETTT